VTAGSPPGAGTSDSDVQRAYRELRRQIVDCEIAPGEQLTQIALASRLGTGRTPLREALRMLQQEGLVIAQENRRIRVAPIDPAELDAQYAARILLECLGAQLTAPCLSDGEKAALTSAWERSGEALAAGSLEAYEQPHAQFHALLACHAGEPMRRKIRDNMAGTERVRRMYTHSVRHSRATANREHEAVLQAMVAGRGEAAAAHLATHLARTALQVMAQFMPDFEPRITRAALRFVLPAAGGRAFLPGLVEKGFDFEADGDLIAQDRATRARDQAVEADAEVVPVDVTGG